MEMMTKMTMKVVKVQMSVIKPVMTTSMAMTMNMAMVEALR